MAPPAKANMNASSHERRAVEQGEPGAGGEPRDDGDADPQDARSCAFVHPSLQQVGGRGDGLGQVGDEHGDEHRGADLAGLQQRQPEHGGLRHAVEHGAEDDRQGRRRLLAARACPAGWRRRAGRRAGR